MSADRWESAALERVRTAKTPEEVQAARAFLDGVKWACAKRAPKVYGDRIEHTGQIDLNVGLAERIERARDRMIETTTEAVVTAPYALPSGADEPESAE
jgi:hypothetical protein